jgi:hypothetical protein
MKSQNLLFVAAMMFILASCAKEKSDPVSPQEAQQESALKKGNSGKNFAVHMTGDQEVPPAQTNAVGQSIFHLRKNGTELHYRVIVANIENVTMAHIHLAPAGANGPVAAWLYPSGPPAQLIPGPYNGVLATGIITSSNLVGPLSGMDLSDLLDYLNDGNAYVNVHTSQFPAGEVRGQF